MIRAIARNIAWPERMIRVKKVMAMAVMMVMALSSVCFADTYVNGYHRHDGTYVQPHHRSDPDGYTGNNWSHQGNTNPYTGERGYNRD